MFDRTFFGSKLGLAALASILAMTAFNVATLTHQMGMTSQVMLVAMPMAELA